MRIVKKDKIMLKQLEAVVYIYKKTNKIKDYKLVKTSNFKSSRDASLYFDNLVKQHDLLCTKSDGVKRK